MASFVVSWLDLAVFVMRQFASSIRAFGLRRGIAVGFVSLGRRTRVRSVPVFGGSRTVELRLGRTATDLATFLHVFADECYDFQLLTAPTVIVDAGAHVGYATVWFAQRYPAAIVVAIEADSDNVEILRRNVAGLQQVQILSAALMAEAGSTTVVDPGHGSWGYRVAKNNDSWATGTRRAMVQSVTVLDILDRFQLERVDLLKIDIEGSELEVMNESAPWIERVDALAIELHDRMLPGCTRAFMNATEAFDFEATRGENTFVRRSAAVPNGAV